MTMHPDYRPWVSDPATCTWVSASAGTGKTKVLTDRVLSLLLHGAQPEKILCLTFTRAAAGEMTNRLYKHLSSWSTLDDTSLIKVLEPLLGSVANPDQLKHARRLFARVLDAKGGMKIMTIHGFCQALLKRFPLEAELPPHFSVLDEQTSQVLLHQAQRDVLLASKDMSNQSALETLSEILDENSFSPILQQLIGKRQYLNLDGGSAHIKEFEAFFQVSLSETGLEILNRFCQATHFDEVGLKHAVQVLNNGEKADQERAQGIASWVFSPEHRLEQLEVYRRLFLTHTGSVRKRLLSTKLQKLNPEILHVLTQEAYRFLELEQHLKKHRIARISSSSVHLGSAIVRRYEELKTYRGALDYNDLILAAGKLLSKPDIAPWVLYKLDGGLDHILVDEAQDTSASQWKVIASLAEEFFSGEGARSESLRSIFVVGDVKQSIYSFQGADPKVFGKMRQHFAGLVKACKQPWQQVNLTTSYRSTAPVLQLVDQVFQSEVAANGVAMDTGEIKHIPHRSGQAGQVEIWPLVQPQDPENESTWPMPVVKTVHRPSPAVVLANQLADQIQQWLNEGVQLESKNRLIRPGDIMVLVQRRTAFVDALIKALKRKSIPIAGNDRLVLTAHLAIQDLMALGQFLLLPEDDLSLATVLKGPLLGLSEDQLFFLAHDRGDLSLWQRLQENAEDNPDFTRAFLYLKELQKASQQLTPYQLYAEILGPQKGRQAFLSRLGHDVLDPLQEFLSLALAYEQNNIASLQNFLHWLDEGDIEIKRDLEQGEQDEVRIMTVHGSKGLQAPIVILPDTTRVPKVRDPLLWRSIGENQQLPVWNPPKDATCELTQPLKERAQANLLQEYNRLLYVAMTRAEDRLYVCGWQNQREPTENCWYLQIQQALIAVGEETTRICAGVHHSVWRLQCSQTTPAQTTDVPQEQQATAETSLPKWLQTPVAISPHDSAVQPSRMQETEVSAQSPLEPLESNRFRRGEVLHKLLEYLPGVAVEKRKDVCHRYLTAYLKEQNVDIDRLTQNISQILQDKRFADVFATGSQAEVAIAGQTKKGLISGQVDRLVVTPDFVLIVDYKTDQKPPIDINSAQKSYIEQLRAYAQCLAGIYPQHRIRCALLWTEVPRLDEIPQDWLQLERAA